MILRDSQGSIILSSCRHLFTCADALEAELLAIKEGISLALQWIYLPIDVESDCSEAISMIKEGVGNKKKSMRSSSRTSLIVWRKEILALVTLVETVIMLVTSCLLLLVCCAELWFG